MDADRFDAFVRALPIAGSRRSALARLFGGALAALLLSHESGDVAARNKNKTRRRRRTKKRKKPRCEGGETRCGATCANLATDASHCGACAAACPSAQCLHGACACLDGEICPAGCQCFKRVQGGTGCADPQLDRQALCATDDDCPLGAFCVLGGDANLCSAPCTE